MTRKSSVVAGVFSLILVGFTGPASAESAPQPAESPPPKVVKLFGKHLCFGDVAPVVTCDWRFPMKAPIETEASTAPRHLTLGGLRLCFGADQRGSPPDEPLCHLTLPALTRDSQPEKTARL